MEEQLVETWNIHNRVNLYLLDAVPPAALGAALTPKFRTAYKLFAHLHNVRLLWLKSAAPELLAGLEKLEAEDGDKGGLAQALEASGKAIEALLHKSIAAGGKVKGFKPHVVAFLGYLIAHESHHRGQIGWTLKGTGHPLDKKTAYGIWEWGCGEGQRAARRGFPLASLHSLPSSAFP
jgi:uncharacterized damage-inducible protein DinB